jgi:hypothetical protein
LAPANLIDQEDNVVAEIGKIVPPAPATVHRLGIASRAGSELPLAFLWADERAGMGADE